jgi:fatty acid desaturase
MAIKTENEKDQIGATVPSKTVKGCKVTDDNILTALEENWLVGTTKVEYKPTTSYEAFIAQFINDPRDVPVVNTIIMCMSLPLSTAIMYISGATIPHAVLHCAVFFFLLRKYVLGLHVSSHSTLFKKEYNYLNVVMPVLLAPFFGQTPYTYYWHHLKMHHVTDNGPDDLSSTLFYQRDDFFHFLHYFLRFYLFIFIELSMFFAKRKRFNAVANILFSEIGTVLSLFYLAKYVDFYTTFVCLILPLNIVRFGMMQGNWVQHAFLQRDDPLGGGLRNSITVVNSSYNKECFNDGYHASHHLHPRRHFLDHPAELLQNRNVYYEHNAIVFKQTNYDEVWWMLMTKNYSALADKWVHVGTCQKPSKEEIIKMLKIKTKRFTEEEIAQYTNKSL